MNIVFIAAFIIRGLIPSIGFEEHGYFVPDGYNAAVVVLYNEPGKFAALDFYDGTLIGCAVSTRPLPACESRTVLFSSSRGNYLSFSVVGEEQEYMLEIEWRQVTFLPFIGR